MRIGIDARCLEWQRGGVARYLIQMFRDWAKTAAGHEYILYFQNAVPDDEILKNPAFKCRVIKGPRSLRGRRIVAEQLLLPWMLWSDRLDLLYAPWYTSPILWPGRKTVLAAWDITYSTHPEHYSVANRISLGWFSRNACRRARRILTCSVFDGRQIAQHYGIPTEKIQVLQLAVDEKFRPIEDPGTIASLRERYRLPQRYLLSLGNLYNRRDVDVIIKAFHKVSDEVPEVGLVVVGRNLTEPAIDLEGLMAPLIAKGRAVYMQWIPEGDLIPMYCGAWFYISTSNADGEAMMLKEAMKCGTPIITSAFLQEAVGGMGVILEDPTRQAGTEETFRRVLPDVNLRNRLALEGREWVKQFTWERVARESMAALEMRRLD